MEEAGIKTATSPQICCGTTLRNVSGQLYSYTAIQLYIHISENNMLYLRHHLFQEFLFVYLIFFLILTSLCHYCNILFVALPIPFNYEDIHLAQH